MKMKLMLGLCLLLMSSVCFASFTAFPDEDIHSGKFMSLTRGLKSLGGTSTHVEFETFPGDSFQLKIFDGNMGGKWDPISPTNAVPDTVVWELFADSQGVGSQVNLVAGWTGGEMPDNDWFEATIQNSNLALTADNRYRYNLVVRWTSNSIANEQNNFKVAVEGVMYLLKGSQYGFIGYTRNDPSDAFPGVESYDGSWYFYPEVAKGASSITLWDGDFDRADDTNDPDSPLYPPFVYSAYILPQGIQLGLPADDAPTGSPLLVSPAVYYIITDIYGGSAINDNPSGNQEWEKFNYQFAQPYEMNGICEWKIMGLDGRNTIFVSAESNIYSAYCSVGDFVWEDIDKNGIQGTNEPGLSGVKVSLYDTSNNLIATTFTDNNGKYLFEKLMPGDYYLVFWVNKGSVTTRYQGDVNTDSNINNDGISEIFTLNNRDVNLSIDAGLIHPPVFKIHKTGIKIDGNCRTIGFWKNNIKKSINGNNKGIQVPKASLIEWLKLVNNFYMSGPFVFNSSDNQILKEAYNILDYNGSNMLYKMKKQLLACELNYVSGMFAMEPATYHQAFCEVVEDAILNNDNLEDLYVMCDDINNLGDIADHLYLNTGDIVAYTINVQISSYYPVDFEIIDYIDTGLIPVNITAVDYQQNNNMLEWFINTGAGSTEKNIVFLTSVDQAPQNDWNQPVKDSWIVSNIFKLRFNNQYEQYSSSCYDTYKDDHNDNHNGPSKCLSNNDHNNDHNGGHDDCYNDGHNDGHNTCGDNYFYNVAFLIY